jgi:hypothetical protein
MIWNCPMTQGSGEAYSGSRANCKIGAQVTRCLPKKRIINISSHQILDSLTRVDCGEVLGFQIGYSEAIRIGTLGGFWDIFKDGLV